MSASSHPEASPVVDVAIIGAGFSGLCMGIRLQRDTSLSFVIFEKADDVGGTWRENRYPGCACDVQSHLYSLSFEPNPRWSRMFAPQAEIWEYLRRCTDKHDLRRRIRFGTRVDRCELDEANRLWILTSSTGERFRARVLVAGVGALHVPAYPTLPGRDRFLGKSFHSAEWDESYPLEGKRVAVIGTGASAIQFVPQIAPIVQHLALFQRTPPWIIPKPDRAITKAEQWLFERVPSLQRAARAAIYWQLESRVLAFVKYPRLMKLAALVAKHHIERQIADPELARKVTPAYEIGCKRILISDDYYPALCRPNVDVMTAPIREIDERGVVTNDGVHHDVDAILYGTGFDVQHPIPRGAIIGRGGRDLIDAWPEGPEAYLGITVSGFPNLFFLLGPNTALGHSSVIYMIESQVAYVMDALRTMRDGGLSEVDVKPEVQRRFNDDLKRRHAGAIWSSGCRSWYLNEHGRNTTLWPGATFRYRALTRSFDVESYHTR